MLPITLAEHGFHTMQNPLLFSPGTDELPPFDQILPMHAEPAIDEILTENRKQMEALLNEHANHVPTWSSLIDPIVRLNERLARAWNPITHLFAVMSTPSWRTAFNACLSKVTAYQIELSSSVGLFRAYEQLSQHADFVNYTEARKRVVRNALRDFRLGGVSLPPEKKLRFKSVSLQLSERQTRFEENVIDATQGWARPVADADLLRGMTEEEIAQARSKARAKGLDGYLLTLDYPSFRAAITHLRSRELRRELYEAFETRASEIGPQAGHFDNTSLTRDILALRHEKAQILGFSSYAELALQTRMARSTEEVEQFLLDLASRARPMALAELEGLREDARTHAAINDFAVWDVAYYAERRRDHRLGLSDDRLRPYFPMPQVITGLFRLAENLFDVRIHEVKDLATWHADVSTYVIRNPDGTIIGWFFLDPYARDNKQGGAWMDECRGRRVDQSGLQRPAAFVTCNFAPPTPGRPVLLTHDEVVTLFHEFGHALQHLLTQVDEADLSGIRGVPWDAVELPSQFMENWCYERTAIDLLAAHWQTREPLPDFLLEKLAEDRKLGAGMATLRQVELALFDLRLHTAGATPDIYGILKQVRNEISVLERPDSDRLPCSFSHIFAGGYAAGYYSYKWAEVLSADAFSVFREERSASEAGRRFRDTVLGCGGARDAMEIFRAFRGRPPSIVPLLVQDGLMTAAPERRQIGMDRTGSPSLGETVHPDATP